MAAAELPTALGRRGAPVRLEGLSKVFADAVAVADLSLEVGAGEFLTLLGPSGSGKSTTLLMIAGFLVPTRGEIFIGGVPITRKPPHERDIGVVFQSYALFPHLTVFDNVAFPLKMRNLPAAQIAQRVAYALDLIRLEGLGRRYPHQLSGGQQQRVALARAMVFEPPLLLMDEPLGALDRKLREAMQIEIVRISREIGVTIVYVTHDQEEALAMSDRVAVFHEGRIEQTGTPEEVYRNPASLFVAGFVGESTTILGRLERRAGREFLVNEHFAIPVSARSCRQADLAPGQAAALVLRPEAISIGTFNGAAHSDANGLAVLPGRMQRHLYLGASRKFVVDLAGGTVAIVRIPPDGSLPAALDSGGAVDIAWKIEDGVVLPQSG